MIPYRWGCLWIGWYRPCAKKCAANAGRFKQHPAIRPLISGGKLLEYSRIWYRKAVWRWCRSWLTMACDRWWRRRLLPEFGFYSSRHDLAIASAQAAATTVIAAKERRISPPAVWRNTNVSWNKVVFARYAAFSQGPGADGKPAPVCQYPRMVADIMNDMFTIDGKQTSRYAKWSWDTRRKLGWSTAERWH